MAYNGRPSHQSAFYCLIFGTCPTKRNAESEKLELKFLPYIEICLLYLNNRSSSYLNSCAYRDETKQFNRRTDKLVKPIR